MLATLKRFLPQSLKRPLRALATKARSLIDERRFRRAVHTLRATPPDHVTRELVVRLRRGWGNETWSGNPVYLHALLRAVAAARGPVLECGTGLSTVVAGVVGARGGIEVWGLEQDAAWHDRMTGVVRQLGLSNVHLILAPLREYEDFLWYDIGAAVLPTHFALALCDGPSVPDGPQKQRSRYGLLPVLRAQGIVVDDVLVDDVKHERVKAMIRAWETEFGRTSVVNEEADGSYGLVRNKT